MRKRLRCLLGLHKLEDTTELLLKQVSINEYKIVKKCKYCKEYIEVGHIVAPNPICLHDLNFRLIEKEN